MVPHVSRNSCHVARDSGCRSLLGRRILSYTACCIGPHIGRCERGHNRRDARVNMHVAPPGKTGGGVPSAIPCVKRDDGLFEGTLISRPNRFLAIIRLKAQAKPDGCFAGCDAGQRCRVNCGGEVGVHVADPGRLKELLVPGRKVCVARVGDASGGYPVPGGSCVARGASPERLLARPHTILRLLLTMGGSSPSTRGFPTTWSLRLCGPASSRTSRPVPKFGVSTRTAKAVSVFDFQGRPLATVC